MVNGSPGRSSVRSVSYGVYQTRLGREEIAEWCRARLDRWSTPHETTTFATPTGDTFALVAGSGRPVVLVPGTNFSTAVWLDVVAAVAAEHQVVAVDVPGQPGLSAGDRPEHARVAYGDWLRAVIQHLGISEPVVVGHSLGGLIALAGVVGSASVAALVLFNPAGLTRLRVTPGVLRSTLPWLVRPSAVTARGLLSVLTTAPIPDHLTAWLALVGSHVRTSLAPAPLPDATLARIAVPVGVYAAARDPFLPPASLRRGAAKLPGSRFTAVPGAGHLLPHEQPSLVVDAVRIAVR